MNTTGEVVIAYFAVRSEAERAVERLRLSGFEADQIGLAAHVPAEDEVETGIERDERIASESDATETVGQDHRSLWDKIAEFFKGHGSGTDSESEREMRGVTGPLGQMGVEDERARYFDHQLSNNPSSVLVTVRANGRRRDAETILEQNGGDVGRNASTFAYPTETATRTGGEGSEAIGESPRRLQLLGEVLDVHKEWVRAGEVRLRKEVVSETKHVQVPVQREELVIERTKASGEAPAGEIGSNEEIRIPLREERVTAGKRPVVREEVQVDKRNVQDKREVSEEVRREELHVDKDDDVKIEEDARGVKTKRRGA